MTQNQRPKVPHALRAPALPTGTVTFLFTDLEKSTRLLAYAASTMRNALATHHELLRRAIEEHSGIVLETVGDAVYAVFEQPSSALAAALACQRALLEEQWGEVAPRRARIAVHTGEVELQGDGRHYVGEALIRCARLLVLGHGGQTLVSNATAELARSVLPAESRLVTLGVHRLRDIFQPESVHQLNHPDPSVDNRNQMRVTNGIKKVPRSWSIYTRDENVAVNCGDQNLVIAGRSR